MQTPLLHPSLELISMLSLPLSREIHRREVKLAYTTLEIFNSFYFTPASIWTNIQWGNIWGNTPGSTPISIQFHNCLASIGNLANSTLSQTKSMTSAPHTQQSRTNHGSRFPNRLTKPAQVARSPNHLPAEGTFFFLHCF